MGAFGTNDSSPWFWDIWELSPGLLENSQQHQGNWMGFEIKFCYFWLLFGFLLSLWAWIIRLLHCSQTPSPWPGIVGHRRVGRKQATWHGQGQVGHIPSVLRRLVNGKPSRCGFKSKVLEVRNKKKAPFIKLQLTGSLLSLSLSGQWFNQKPISYLALFPVLGVVRG